MGTRSTIALEFADGTVEQVYCHWDGYLSNNGKLLAQHYMDPFKVKQLIALGDFSSLRETIDETKEGCYNDDSTARRYKNLDEYFAECQQEEYDYLLRQVNGKAVWSVRCYYSQDKWMTLEQAFVEEAALADE